MQYVILANLCWFKMTGQNSTQAAIVQNTKMDKMTVSKSLKKLITMKLVTRVEYEKDTRAKLVTLTAEGEKLAAELVQVVETIDRKFFDVLSKEEQKELIRLFYKLV